MLVLSQENLRVRRFFSVDYPTTVIERGIYRFRICWNVSSRTGMAMNRFLKMKIPLGILWFSLLLSSCSNEKINDDASSGERVGAVCMDGWRSNATGRGACSHHGGVRYWVYQ